MFSSVYTGSHAMGILRSLAWSDDIQYKLYAKLCRFIIDKKSIQDPFVFISDPTALIGQKNCTSCSLFISYLFNERMLQNKFNDSIKLNNLVRCVLYKAL